MPGTPDLLEGYGLLEEARPGYVEADKYYKGTLGEVFASPRVRLLLQRAGATQVKDFNYAHIPVDTIAHRLSVTALTVVEDTDGDGNPDEPDDDAPVSPAQKALDDLRKANQLDAELPGLIKRASKHGDAYLFVWPVTEGNDGTPGKVVGVDIRVNAAECVRAVYDEEDPLKLKFVVKSWTITDADPQTGQPRKRTRANLYYDDRLERFVSVGSGTKKALAEADSWEPFTADKKPAVIQHDLGRNPWFHFRNDRPYGTPEHEHAYGPQQMVNKLVVADAGAVDFQSFPQRYAVMDFAADQTMSNLSDPWGPDDDTEDPEDPSNGTQLSAEPSTVWKFFGAKSVGQFATAAADVFLSRLDRYVQAMAETTETPLYRFGSHFAQTPSGEALRQADAPTVNRAEDRKSAYGPVLSDALEFALSLLGHKVEVRVTWKSSQQVTDAEGWNTVNTKIAAGVPRSVALVETGNYTSDQVAKWLSEDADSALIRRVESLGKLATAAQALGAAVGLGVMDRELAARLVQFAAGEMAGNEELADLLMEADPPPEPEKPEPPAPVMLPGQPLPPGQPPPDLPQDGQQPPPEAVPPAKDAPKQPPSPPKPPPPPPRR